MSGEGKDESQPSGEWGQTLDVPELRGSGSGNHRLVQTSRAASPQVGCIVKYESWRGPMGLSPTEPVTSWVGGGGVGGLVNT